MLCGRILCRCLSDSELGLPALGRSSAVPVDWYLYHDCINVDVWTRKNSTNCRFKFPKSAIQLLGFAEQWLSESFFWNFLLKWFISCYWKIFQTGFVKIFHNSINLRKTSVQKNLVAFLLEVSLGLTFNYEIWYLDLLAIFLVVISRGSARSTAKLHYLWLFICQRTQPKQPNWGSGEHLKPPGNWHLE